MCGITGYVGIDEEGLLERMTAALAHRGPDSGGFFRDGNAGLGFRRLSIIDVAGGDQPIANEDGSLVIIFNGEIYNYRPLREELLARGHRFRTASDTEVILHLFEEMGPACLSRLNGMWGLAIWDTKRRRLFLARDRMGVKPVYFVQLGDRFLFGSEFKSILQYRGFQPTLNPVALAQYLSLRYVPGPGGMFDQLQKLPAGHYAVVEAGKVSLTRYWEPEVFAGRYTRTDQEYLDEFAEHFERSVRMRLMSEVPLGAYLSGGVDSGAIVAAMSRMVPQPIRTFTVGFDYQHDELDVAADTARRLGCRHTAIDCRASDVELLPRIVWHLDEPLGDPIVLPLYLLAREAKKDVTVVLTGEGADEILGGYVFQRALLSAHRLSHVPRVVRRLLLSPALALTPASVLNLAFDYPATLGQRGKQKVQDFLDLVEPDQLPAAFHHLLSLFDARDTAPLLSAAFRAELATRAPWHPVEGAVPEGAPFLNRIVRLQFDHWLPDVILRKQDQLAMANAIEARVPFLDYQLVEFALRLPPHLRISGRTTKVLLRRYLQRHLPKEAVERRKMPFYVPLENFLLNPAFEAMVDDTLSEEAVRARGIFEPAAVMRLRRAMRGREFMHLKQVFSLVVLELWFRMAVDGRGRAP